jgi:hypothetical protein
MSLVDTTLEAADDDETVALLAAAGDPDPGDEEGVVLFSYSTGDVVERWTRARIRGLTIVDVPAFADAVIDLDGETDAVQDDEAAEGDDDVEPEAEGEQAVAASGGAATACCDSCAAAGQHVVTAAARTASPVLDVDRPPAEWFDNPHLPLLTPLTITREGRVLGHLAPWGQCHTGSPAGECVLTPRSSTGYAYFHTGVIDTDRGERAVGALTIGGGHADLRLNYRGAAAHYDDVSSVWADVIAGEDAYGVFVTGAVRPSVLRDGERMRAIRAASPSGDWRTIGGGLEMIAALSVVAPGFPAARVAAGRPTAIVAAGAEVMRRVAAVAARHDEHGDLTIAELSRRVERLERERLALGARDRRRLAAIGRDRAADRLRTFART